MKTGRNSITFVSEVAGTYKISKDTVLYQYLEKKTKASNRDSKARRSLGNLYALYVLCEDYVNGNTDGSTFTDLMRRMKSMPFGARLQNHPLDNRLNDEVRRRFDVTREMLPVQPAYLPNKKKARKISEELLSENGMNPREAAKFVVDSIDEYIGIITRNQTEYLDRIEAATSDKEIVEIVQEAFDYKSDARLFEIISYALLFLHYRERTITFMVDEDQITERLTLFRTGRTNANDGGIDFVLKPVGRFFQVTETLDFKKYFLDFEKINRFPLTFVIKTQITPEAILQQIKAQANEAYKPAVVETYMSLFEEIFTIQELKDILTWVSRHPDKIKELQKVVVQCFKLEYGLLD